MGFKCWIIPINHLNAHLLFEFLGGGTLYSLDPGLKDVNPITEGDHLKDKYIEMFHTDFSLSIYLLT